MVTAKIWRTVQRADKRGEVAREPGGLISRPVRILNPPVVGHNQSLSPRTWRSR